MEDIEYVIYCRKSTDESTERQIQSIPDQIKTCIDFAKEQGLKIASKPKDFSFFESEADIKKQNSATDQYSKDIFKATRGLFVVKEEKTAKQPGVRTKWNHLMKMVKEGKIKGIISYHPDRQARNMRDAGILITYVDDGLVDLKYPKFHFEATATGKMMLGFLFVFSKQYSDNISESVTRGNNSGIERGKAIGTKKYGFYINDEGYHAPDGKNFTLFKEAFQMKLYEDKTNQQISDWLVSRGFTRKSKGGEVTEIDSRNLGRVWRDPEYAWGEPNQQRNPFITFYIKTAIYGENWERILN